jgi:hypothetical protein
MGIAVVKKDWMIEAISGGGDFVVPTSRPRDVDASKPLTWLSRCGLKNRDWLVVLNSGSPVDDALGVGAGVVWLNGAAASWSAQHYITPNKSLPNFDIPSRILNA